MQDQKQQFVKAFKQLSQATTPREKSIAFVQLVGLISKAKKAGGPKKSMPMDKEKKDMSKGDEKVKKKQLNLKIKDLPKMDMGSMMEGMMK